ncbi:MAG: manganese efflux pump MntP family protein [Candidatus Daviesbacteria bacterium]|nr:manganese efflux pump MntP family protein [Candidatus Daviesbacteria bacterium]
MLLQIFLIAISLSLDAFGVSIAGGIKSKDAKIIHALKIAAFFGIFQAAMPIIGWFIGGIMKNSVSSIDHWIAFALLSGIGINMLRETSKEKTNHKNIIDTRILLLLAIATSIDAFVVGITLPLLKIPLLLSVTIIGSVTFISSFFGFLFGKKLGVTLDKKVEIIAGVVLILIGLKILLEHLLI